MNRALRNIARAISQSLVTEMNRSQPLGQPASVNIVDLLLQRVAEEVVKELGKATMHKSFSCEEFEARLDTIEGKLERLAVKAPADHEDETGESTSSFPNLKYVKPKYQNVESLLNYVETDQDKGGLKLVIMNFND